MSKHEEPIARWAGGVCKTCGNYTHSCKCRHPGSEALRGALFGGRSDDKEGEPFCWYIVRRAITDEYETVYNDGEGGCPGPGWKPLYERLAPSATPIVRSGWLLRDLDGDRLEWEASGPYTEEEITAEIRKREWRVEVVRPLLAADYTSPAPSAKLPHTKEKP